MRCSIVPPMRLYYARFCGPWILGLLFGLYRPSSLPAQDKPAPTLPPAAALPAPPTPSDLSKEALVFDKLYTRIREESDGTGTRLTTARVHILADAGVKDMAVLTFTYTSLNQQVEIAYVRVIKPDGTVVVTPPYNVQDLPADVTRTAPMYSDIHQKHVAVKGLGVGDTLEYQIALNTLKPEVPGHFWFEYSFQKDLINLDEQVDLDIPADKAVTVASAATDAQPSISTSAGRKLYHWASANLARPDPDAPPKSVKHWKPSIQVTTFSSWEQVGAWYQSLQRDSLAVTPAIQAKAAALTKGLTNDEDKTHAIFNDVALHIHYVGLEFGIGRYQPHSADDVLSNEYGDCKDKHTLLAAELKAVGIDAWPVLISSGRELDPATPSPAQFNHVITLVPLGGKLLWMDSTEEVSPIGELMAPLRDKEALAIPNGRPPYLEHTPIDLPFTQSARFQVDGKLSDQGVFTGHIVQSYHGDVELFLRVIFRQVPQSQWKESMQRFSQGIGFSGEVSNPQFSEIEQTSQPLQFSYDYTREKFGDWDAHRIYPSMPSTGWALSPGVKEKKPADEVEIGSPGEQVYVSNVILPKGWSLVPQQGTDLKQDWAEYQSTYTLKDGVFGAQRCLLIKKNKVPLDDWDKYIAFRRAIYTDEVQTAYLLNPSAAQNFKPFNAGGTGPRIVYTPKYEALTNGDLEEMRAATQPLRDAISILATNPPPTPDDLAKALDLCRKTVNEYEARSQALPPDDPHSLHWARMLDNAWSILGWAALESKDLPTAETYLRASWQNTQDQMAGFQLARLLEAKGEKAAAAHLLELAYVTGVNDELGEHAAVDYNLHDRIAEAYHKITGKPMTATSLNRGQYNGSLRAELDKDIEIHGYTKSSKLNGEALFTIAFEEGKPVKARFFNGDKAFESVATVLEGHRFPVALPQGSKARLLREVRLICAPYGGCDAYMLLPNNIQIPVHQSPPVITTSRPKVVQMVTQH
jgi:transglutaminase-like putative cysteine protease